jgi:hypothetical protein
MLYILSNDSPSMEKKLEESMLDGICAHVNDHIRNDVEVTTPNVMAMLNLEELTGSQAPHYSAFTQEYITLFGEYHSKREKLLNPSVEIKYSRVFWNSIAMAGSAATLHPIGVVVGAATGCALTLYSETKKIPVDLSYTFFGTLLGGWAGSLAYKPFGVVGAAIGAGIGLYFKGKDALREHKENKRKFQSTLDELETERTTNTRTLYNKFLPRLLEATTYENVVPLFKK